MNNPARSNSRREWGTALLVAAPVTAFVLSLLYYWFGVADRYAIFLYGHTSRGISTAQPFDEMTSSRYWMAGLVASGAVLMLYTALNWIVGRIAAWRGRIYSPPVWWRVWALCAPPLTIGIPLITMNVNSPTLPLSLALACVVVALAGLACALWPGERAAQWPYDLVWLIGDGLGLMPTLMFLRVVELPGRGLSVTVGTAYAFAIGGTLAGIVWLIVMTGLRKWRGTPLPGSAAVLMMGLGLSYLLMPLVHHLLATPPAYRYISAASNFFAFDPGLQTLTFVVAIGLAFGVTQVRKRLRPWLNAQP